MCMCEKCSKMSGVLLVVIGVLFLLQDVGIWNFWNLNWYTLAFLIGGLTFVGAASCDKCQATHKKK